MPRKASAKTTKLSPTVQPSSTASINSIGGALLHITWLLFKWAFVFGSDTCINPLTWLIAMVIRGVILYFIMFQYEDEILKYFTLPDGHTSIFALPVGLFILWYFFTSALMFLGAIYSGFGRLSTEDEGKYSQFEKLGDNLNAKMKFQSYKQNLDMLTGKDKK